MDLVHDQKVLTRLDFPVTSSSESFAKWTKVAILVALVVVSVSAVMATEIELLKSDTLVVVMPE